MPPWLEQGTSCGQVAWPSLPTPFHGHPPPLVVSWPLLATGRGLCRTLPGRRGGLLKQAEGMLKPHQEALSGHPTAAAWPARRQPLTYTLHAGRPRRTRDHAGWGWVKTKERRPVSAELARDRRQHHAWPPWPATTSTAIWEMWPGLRGEQARAPRPGKSQDWVTPCPSRQPSPGGCHLTFLHRDGRLLLPQPQEDEEEDKRDEDLKGQDPLEKGGQVTPLCRHRTCTGLSPP